MLRATHYAALYHALAERGVQLINDPDAYLHCHNDEARRADGAWTIIELGDGRVAGLPAPSGVPAFYGALAERWPAE